LTGFWPSDPKDVFNRDGLVDELKKALSERILNTELDEHLDAEGIEGKSNHRNGRFLPAARR
jgi:putative transposase